jgi:transposase
MTRAFHGRDALVNRRHRALQVRAFVLRAQGKSIRVIAAELGVARSTVGGWLRYVGQEPLYDKCCERCGANFQASRSHARLCAEWCCRHWRERPQSEEAA